MQHEINQEAIYRSDLENSNVGMTSENNRNVDSANLDFEDQQLKLKMKRWKHWTINGLMTGMIFHCR